MRAGAAALVAILALSGCASSGGGEQASQVVSRFYAALDADRPDDACAQLSSAAVTQLESQEGEPCDEAIATLDIRPGPVTAAQAYITNAKVDAATGESTFLSLEPEGWRISAIACVPESGKPADRPFECEVES